MASVIWESTGTIPIGDFNFRNDWSAGSGHFIIDGSGGVRLISHGNSINLEVPPNAFQGVLEIVARQGNQINKTSVTITGVTTELNLGQVGVGNGNNVSQVMIVGFTFIKDEDDNPIEVIPSPGDDDDYYNGGNNNHDGDDDYYNDNNNNDDDDDDYYNSNNNNDDDDDYYNGGNNNNDGDDDYYNDNNNNDDDDDDYYNSNNNNNDDDDDYYNSNNNNNDDDDDYYNDNNNNSDDGDDYYNGDNNNNDDDDDYYNGSNNNSNEPSTESNPWVPPSEGNSGGNNSNTGTNGLPETSKNDGTYDVPPIVDEDNGYNYEDNGYYNEYDYGDNGYCDISIEDNEYHDIYLDEYVENAIEAGNGYLEYNGLNGYDDSNGYQEYTSMVVTPLNVMPQTGITDTSSAIVSGFLVSTLIASFTLHCINKFEKKKSKTR